MLKVFIVKCLKPGFNKLSMNGLVIKDKTIAYLETLMDVNAA